jgi:uncharacterized OB-fold protein
MSGPESRIVPERTELTEHYWARAARGVIALQRCGDCAQVWHPPSPSCPTNPSHRIEWFDASGRGQLYSYTQVEHAAHPAVADQLPYVIALIDLEEGPRFVCGLIDADVANLKPGAEITLNSAPTVGGLTLPMARLSPSPAR